MKKYTLLIVTLTVLLAFVITSCASAPEAAPEEPAEVPETSAPETPEPEEVEEDVEEVAETVEEEGDVVEAQVRELLRQLDSFDNVTVTVTADGVDIAITRAFGPNSTVVNSRLEQQLNLVGQVLNLIDLDALVIEGHVANVGNPADNAPISEGRAENTADYLVDNYDIPSRVVTTVGRGGADPIASNANESGRARNRRVVLLIRGTV
jgi:outer membrane protein OmpA-like peptidoglycan-associated protein